MRTRVSIVPTTEECSKALRTARRQHSRHPYVRGRDVQANVVRRRVAAIRALESPNDVDPVQISVLHHVAERRGSPHRFLIARFIAQRLPYILYRNVM